VNRFLVALVALVSFAMAIPDAAEGAGRLGGGRSLGAQRQVTPPQRQATPPSQQQAQPAAPQSQPSGPGRWLAPLAGLAAGLGLGWLFAQGGAGALLATLVLALGAGFILMLLLRTLGRPRDARTTMQYAGPGGGRLGSAPPSPAPLAGRATSPDEADPFAGAIPAGFDVDGFLRQAKRNFLALQDANDRGDVAALREVTTPEMFAALADDVAAHAGSKQQTDVVTLHPALLEVVTEGPVHWASVRFEGTIREDPHALPAGFEEVWHLQKPVDGSSGWLLAGIQQAA
jgi:predicted lipid-binding transport protein (Tim44 family)